MNKKIKISLLASSCEFMFQKLQILLMIQLLCNLTVFPLAFGHFSTVMISFPLIEYNA